LLQLLGDEVIPQTSYRGFAPGAHWGTVLQTPWPGPHHVNPSFV